MTKKFKKQMAEVIHIEDVLCDKCGESCMYEFSGPEMKDNYGVHIEFHSGYLSKYFPDCNIYGFDVCEKCMFEFVQSFKTKLEPLLHDED